MAGPPTKPPPESRGHRAERRGAGAPAAGRRLLAASPRPTLAPDRLTRAGRPRTTLRRARDAFQAGCSAARDAALQALRAAAPARSAGADDGGQGLLRSQIPRRAVPGTPGRPACSPPISPRYEARDRRDAEFSAPVRPRPTGTVQPAAPSRPPPRWRPANPRRADRRGAVRNRPRRRAPSALAAPPDADRPRQRRRTAIERTAATAPWPGCGRRTCSSCRSRARGC